MSSGSSQKAGRPAKDRSNKPHSGQTQSTKNAADGCKVTVQDGPNPKVQPTAEQIRIAQIINDSNKTDPDLQKKIEQIVELTGKSNDAAIVALYDCDNDPVRAIDMLLDGDQNEGEWETRGKKKKKNQGQVTLQKSPEVSVNNNNNNVTNNKEIRNRGEQGGQDGRDEHRNREGSSNRGPPRLNRGGKSWRSKEHEKNERNLEDGHRDRSSEGRFRGQRRGRGRGGSRSRTFQNRGLSTDGFPQSIDTWTNSTAEQGEQKIRTNTTMTVGNWHEVHTTASEDWSEEDWNGSLTETKVFTPSASSSAIDEIASSHISQSLDLASLLQKSNSSPDAVTTNLLLSVGSPLQSQVSDLTQSALQPTSSAQHGQNQFSLSQYAQQATETIKAAVGITSSLSNSSASLSAATPGASYPSGFVTNSIASAAASLTLADIQQPVASAVSLPSTETVHSKPPSASQASALPPRTKPSKARVPPPSKIPESAVEMPDGAVVSLDVQFGALEFGSDSQFDMMPTTESSVFADTGSSISTSVTSHMPSKTTVGSQSSGPSSSSSLASTNSLSKETFPLGSHAQGVGACTAGPASSGKDLGQPASISQNALGPSSKISGPESILLPSQSERKGSLGVASYNNQRPSSSAALDGTTMVKQDSANLNSFSSTSHQSSHSGHSGSYSGPYSGQKSSVLSSSALTPSANSFSHSTASLPSLNSQPMLGSGNPGQTSYVSSQNQNSVFPSSSSTYIQQSMYSGTSQASAGTSYSSQTGFNSQSSSSYPSGVSTYGSQQGYSGPTSVATPSANASLHSSSMQSTKLASSLPHGVKDAVLESQQAASQHSYESSHTSATGNGLTSTNTSTTAGLAGTGIGVSSSLVLTPSTASSSTTTTVLKNSLSASTSRSSAGKTMPNIPPGVPAATAMLGHQYIMGQSLPFYGLQQTLYSYEDLQMLQSRLQPLGYYDMQFQAPSSLTGRDPGLGSIAYTGADGKFSRADNDAAAVATTLSQGQATTQAHGQPYLNPAATLPPGYGYYFPGGMMPGSIHHYGPPIFPVTPATNAHGASTGTQFQKPTAYGSHSYGSAYDTLTQAQDYAKGTYGTSSQGQGKGVSGAVF